MGNSWNKTLISRVFHQRCYPMVFFFNVVYTVKLYISHIGRSFFFCTFQFLRLSAFWPSVRLSIQPSIRLSVRSIFFLSFLFSFFFSIKSQRNQFCSVAIKNKMKWKKKAHKNNKKVKYIKIYSSKYVHEGN